MRIIRLFVLFFTTVSFLLSSFPASAEDAAAEKDHNVDFAVIPGPSYSPSLGWGLMVIPLLMYDVDPDDTISPASSTAAFMMITQNDSYAIGLGQKLYLFEDDLRISAGAGYANIKQKFYGIGDTATEDYVDMSVEVRMANAYALYQVIRSCYLGPSFQYKESRFRGDDTEAQMVLDIFQLNYDYESNFVPGVIGQIDTRDDQVAPQKGFFIDSFLRYSNTSFGSTSTYERVGVSYSQYAKLWDNAKHVLAWLAVVETGFGDVPFDEYPDLGAFKALRGFVKGEYTDKNLVSAQAEYRWNVWGRFGLTGFFGAGKVFPEMDSIDDVDWHPAGGFGLRYLVMPARRMNSRLDFAWSERGFNFYFSVGEAF